MPVGVPAPLASATVMVKVSATFTSGAALAGTTVVVVAKEQAEAPELTGHAAARLFRSTEPSPVTSS